jgi:hypothetical protein
LGVEVDDASDFSPVWVAKPQLMGTFAQNKHSNYLICDEKAILVCVDNAEGAVFNDFYLFFSFESSFFFSLKFVRLNLFTSK